MQPSEPELDRWVEWPWHPGPSAFGLLAIAGVAAACGTIKSAPHHDIPAATWAAEAALSGLGFGVLLGHFHA